MMFPAVGAAQEILVTVSPTQPVLPPQALLYLDNPSKFFNIRITNLTSKVQNIYLGLDLTQVIPDNRMSMKTPPMRMPRNPLTLNPNQTKILTRGEARQLFAHLLLSEVSMSGGVLTDYTNGIMALLPEGTYSGRITAYRYDPSLVERDLVTSGAYDIFEGVTDVDERERAFLRSFEGIGQHLSVLRTEM